MKSLTFLLIFIGTIMVIIGYINQKNKLNYKTKIEYRYLPQSLYQQQIQTKNILKDFAGMFNDPSIKT